MLNLVIDGWCISGKLKLPSNESHWTFNDDKSIVVQVIAWSRQATSHYLNQCWPRPVLPYGVTEPQWVKIMPNFFPRANELTGWPWCYIYSNIIACEYLNSSALGRFQFNFRWVIFKLILVNGGWGISYEIALRCMPLDLTDDKSTLVQVMAWCHQATSHYLSQCWPRSVLPNSVTRPQWVN